MVRRYTSSEPQEPKLYRLNKSIETSLSNAVSTTNASANFLVNDALAHYLSNPDLWPKPDEDLDDVLQQTIKKLAGENP